MSKGLSSWKSFIILISSSAKCNYLLIITIKLFTTIKVFRIPVQNGFQFHIELFEIPIRGDAFPTFPTLCTIILPQSWSSDLTSIYEIQFLHAINMITGGHYFFVEAKNNHRRGFSLEKNCVVNSEWNCYTKDCKN